MAQIIKSIKVILCCVLLQGCTTLQKENGKINTTDIRGLWGCFHPDSTYIEAFILSDSILVHSDFSDSVYRKYKIKNDSIYIYLWDHTPIGSFQLKIVNVDTFSIIYKGGISNYFRIIDSTFNVIDLKQINGGDDDFLFKYRIYYLSRRFDAEN